MLYFTYMFSVSVIQAKGNERESYSLARCEQNSGAICRLHAEDSVIGTSQNCYRYFTKLVISLSEEDENE